MNRTQFYPGQVPTEGEMNQCFDQVEEAVNDITLRGIGYGWQYGAVVGINGVDPRSLDVYAFQGNAYPSGITMKNSSTLNLKTTHSGYTSLGAAGQADGSAISVSDGYRRWVNVMVVAEESESDVRIKSGVNYYWLKNKTFKFRLTPGDQGLTASGFPDPPSLPSEENAYLVLCDVCLKNVGGTTTIELIDDSRRTKWKGGKLGHLYLGTPAFIAECKLKALASWSAGDPYDYDDFLDPDDGLVPDVLGNVVWTKNGVILKQRIAGDNDGIILSFPILNPGTTDVVKNITFKSKPHAASGGADFMEMRVIALGAPYDVITGSWNASTITDVTFAQGTKESETVEVTFSPGRNLLRVYFRNINPENNLTAHIANEFIDHSTLFPDTEMLEGILHYGQYFAYTSNII
ncbi:MAG: hypothetical protein KA807_15700 [Prolixibacteraceae bacterium]|nr:hypothetical protein [Prolixibacteraceae bacterium]